MIDPITILTLHHQTRMELLDQLAGPRRGARRRQGPGRADTDRVRQVRPALAADRALEACCAV